MWSVSWPSNWLEAGENGFLVKKFPGETSGCFLMIESVQHQILLLASCVACTRNLYFLWPSLLSEINEVMYIVMDMIPQPCLLPTIKQMIVQSLTQLCWMMVSSWLMCSWESKRCMWMPESRQNFHLHPLWDCCISSGSLCGNFTLRTQSESFLNTHPFIYKN